MPRILFIALIASFCVACGAPSSAPQAQTSAAPASPAASDAEMQAAVAALPAPLSAATYARGRSVFGQCRSCHFVEAGAGDSIGPNLHEVFGRRSGTGRNFRYSPAMRNAGLTWDAATLDRYLENPRATVPGTLMVFAGVQRPEDRRDVIAFLAVQKSH
jgi:cytochrome c